MFDLNLTLDLKDLPDWVAYAAKIYPTIAAIDFARYLIAAGGVYLIVNFALSRLLAGRKIRSERPPARQIVREFLASFRTSLIFASLGMSIVMGHYFGFATLHERPDEWGWGYFAATVLLLIVLHDTWFYWTHRIIHHPRLFRHLHRLHHKSNNPTPWTAYAFDMGEAHINAAYLPLVVMLLPGVSPLALFLFTGHMIIRNAIGHCGYELFPASKSGKPLFDWMTTTTHHDLHHARAGYNYGLYFTFWDRMMGTEYPDYYDAFAKSVRREGAAPARKFAVGLVSFALIAGGAIFVISTADIMNEHHSHSTEENQEHTHSFLGGRR
jgi:sterol desaturase/sphingolipid hydroxylase (fatty acid hydroxylase superfamily)